MSHESAVLFRNLVERGREYERNMDVRAAVQCYEVRCLPSAGQQCRWQHS